MIFVAFSVLRLIFHIGFGIKKMHNAFRQFTGNDTQSSTEKSEKVYSKSDGEYVDFEEVPSSDNDDASATAYEQDDEADCYVQQNDSRISDAEYEEID